MVNETAKSKTVPTVNEIKATKSNFPLNFISRLSDLIDLREKAIPTIKNNTKLMIKYT